MSSGFSSVFSKRTTDLKQRLSSSDIHKNSHMADVGTPQWKVSLCEQKHEIDNTRHLKPQPLFSITLYIFAHIILKTGFFIFLFLRHDVRLIRKFCWDSQTGPEKRRRRCLDCYQMYREDLSRGFTAFFPQFKFIKSSYFSNSLKCSVLVCL